MKDGGVYALTIPKAPYRCPPGPYERACMVANYFKQFKPKSKVLVLDANPDIMSKKGAVRPRPATDHYKDIVEYRANNELKSVDAATEDGQAGIRRRQGRRAQRRSAASRRRHRGTSGLVN